MACVLCIIENKKKKKKKNYENLLAVPILNRVSRIIELLVMPHNILELSSFMHCSLNLK